MLLFVALNHTIGYKGRVWSCKLINKGENWWTEKWQEMKSDTNGFAHMKRPGRWLESENVK